MPSDATRLKRALSGWAQAVTIDAQHRTAEQVRQDAPRVTGELARSIREVPVRKVGDRFVGGLEATVIQAATTDKGARPHQIRPKSPGGRLRFVTKSGQTVFARVVNHPGNKPRRWWKASQERRWPGNLRKAARSRTL